MKKMILLMALLSSALLLGSCSLNRSSLTTETEKLSWPENLIDIQTNLADSRLDFKINSPDDEAIHYSIFYNNQLYKTYTKSEKKWNILYDYSFKDVTKVTIRATAEPDLSYEKSVLIVIEPEGFDFSKNKLETYYASREAVTLKEIASLRDQLVSVELEGGLISGDLSAFKDCPSLRRLNLMGCTNITGNPELLSELTNLTEVSITN